MREHWRPVPGLFGSYEASNLGRVRSVERIASDGRKLRGKVLRPSSQRSGHRGVSLSKGGRVVKRRVHVLVLQSFKGFAPAGQETRHRNGDPADNRLANLCYGTRRQNALDMYSTGKRAGERSHFAKLSDARARRLYRLRGVVSSRVAAARYGISSSYVRQLWRGERRCSARV